MSVLASAMTTLTYVTSVESETRYYKTQVSTLSPPSKPTSVPPGNGWIETEPTYSDSSATSVLYTCVLTQFTDGTFAYSEVSVSSSYEASKSAYNQAHEANQKLASWCSKTDTTLFDGAKIATGSVITEALDAGCVTTDKLATRAVKAKNIDTENLFAQDITATGTITGAQLIGAILSGENINIVSERVYDDTDEDGLLYQRIYTQTVIKTVQEQNGVDYLLLKQASVTDDYNDNPPAAANTPYRTDVSYGDGSYIKLMNEGIFVHTPYILDVNGGTDTYTSFSGGVVSDGWLTVTKKLGTCWISGSVTLSKSITDWTTILSSAKVPAPQHYELVPFTVSQWGSSYIQPLRGKVLADGGLQIRGGAAKEYVFSLSYPIE